MPPATRIFRDTTASAAPVGSFYYRASVSSSGTVSQANTIAGSRPPTTHFAIVFEAAGEDHRMIGATERLKSFENTIVVESLGDLRTALGRRQRELHG